MAESSIFWTTNGTGDGTGSGYTQSQLFEFLRSLLVPNATNLGGVAPDYQNKLAVSGSSSPVSVATGAGLVYGIPYVNTGTVTVAIPTPASQTRIDRIVLRANYTAQTVRITRIAGTEGAAAPALTQSAGVTWDIPLAQVSITTSGVITITDQREWLSLVGTGAISSTKLADGSVTSGKLGTDSVTAAAIAASAVGTSELADNGVTAAKILDRNVVLGKIALDAVTDYEIAALSVGASELKDGGVWEQKIATGAVTVNKIADGAVQTSKLATGAVDATAIASGAVTTAKIAAGAVTGTEIANGAVTEGKIGTGAVTNAKLGDDSVTHDKVGDGVPRQRYRKGGSTTGFATAGVNNYLTTTTDILMSSGVTTLTFSAAASVSTTITLAESFSDSFYILATLQSDPAVPICVHTYFVSNNSFTIKLYTADGGTLSTTVNVGWLVMGPTS